MRKDSFLEKNYILQRKVYASVLFLRLPAGKLVDQIFIFNFNNIIINAFSGSPAYHANYLSFHQFAQPTSWLSMWSSRQIMRRRAQFHNISPPQIALPAVDARQSRAFARCVNGKRNAPSSYCTRKWLKLSEAINWYSRYVRHVVVAWGRSNAVLQIVQCCM